MTVADHPTAPPRPRSAGFGSRVTAYLLDWLVTFILTCLFLAAAGLFLLAVTDMGRRDPTDRDMVWFIAIALLSAPVWLALTLGGWAWYGRSVGKLAMNLRIVSSAGNRPGVLRAALRILVYVIENAPLAAALPAGVAAWMLRGQLNISLTLAALGGSFLLPLLSVVLLWRDRYHRSLHDLLSGTRVIVDQSEANSGEE